MLRFDIFLYTLLYVWVYNFENVGQKGVSGCSSLVLLHTHLCWGPAPAGMGLGVYLRSATDHRSFKPSHNPGKEVPLLPHFIEEAVEAQTGEVMCTRIRHVIRLQAPRPPSHIMHLEIWVLCCQSKLGFFELSGAWDCVLKGIDQHFLILNLVAEGNLDLASPRPLPNERSCCRYVFSPLVALAEVEWEPC